MIAATIPNCKAYDPAFAYELAVIMHAGILRMMDEQRDEFYYLTVMNENYAQPSMPEGCEEGILKGLYKLGERGKAESEVKVRLVGSGTILNEVIAAADILADDFGIASEIFSATSFSELSREARSLERRNRLSPQKERAKSYVETCLPGELPIIAATDYVRAVPEMIAPYVEGRLVALGTDGFGRSDQREALRRFFEVDRESIAIAAIEALVRAGHIEPETLTKALKSFGIDGTSPDPWTV